MARPQKQGLDYFPLDTNIDQDDKVIIIIAKYGMQGFGILVKLLMEIYKNGYFYPWAEKEQIIFSSRVSVDINTVSELVNDCIKWGLFNQEMYEKHQALTSKGIQERFLLAAARRVNVTINDDIKLVSVDRNLVNDDSMLTESTQSKRKETKTKKKNNNPPIPPKASTTKVQYAEFVAMTEEEYTKLVEKHGEQKARELIELLDNYKGSHGKKYKSDYRAILSWVLERWEENSKKRGKTDGKNTNAEQLAAEYGEALKF